MSALHVLLLLHPTCLKRQHTIEVVIASRQCIYCSLARPRGLVKLVAAVESRLKTSPCSGVHKESLFDYLDGSLQIILALMWATSYYNGLLCTIS